jgi:hypothetical protein
MANPDKKVIPGKVEKEKNSDRKFKIKKNKESELDVDIDILQDGNYHVDKLETDLLPTNMPDGTLIQWFNNFSIKQNGEYINQRYKVKIPGLSKRIADSRLVIFNGNGELYYYEGIVENDTFELTDGDPAAGQAP